MGIMWTSVTHKTTVGDNPGQQSEAQRTANGISALWGAKSVTLDTGIILGVDVAVVTDQMGVMLDTTIKTVITTKTNITTKTGCSLTVASQMARSMLICGQSIAGSCMLLTEHRDPRLGWAQVHSKKV